MKEKKEKKRKTWWKWAQTHTNKCKNARETERFVEKNTPPSSPGVVNGELRPVPSTSRVESAVIKKYKMYFEVFMLASRRSVFNIKPMTGNELKKG